MNLSFGVIRIDPPKDALQPKTNMRQCLIENYDILC